MDNMLINYINDWEREKANSKQIHFMPQIYFGRIFGIDVRFSPTMYDLSPTTYTELFKAVLTASNEVVIPFTDARNFQIGIFSAKISFCKSSYDEKKVFDAVRKISDTLLAHKITH